MTPAKLLIAQRLDERAREGYAIAELMAEHTKDPRWESAVAEVARSAELDAWWANEIRAEK